MNEGRDVVTKMTVDSTAAARPPFQRIRISRPEEREKRGTRSTPGHSEEALRTVMSAPREGGWRGGGGIRAIPEQRTEAAKAGKIQYLNKP